MYIANKESRMIINASSKKEINEILNPKPPRFDGNQFISSEYLTTEEELICWLKACEQAPLNYFAVKRTEELFNKISASNISGLLTSARDIATL